jgi:hypothetical protein
MKYLILTLLSISSIILFFAIIFKKPIPVTRVESIQKVESNDSQFKYLIVNTVKLSHLEMPLNDFPDYYTFDSAKLICESLGQGWRLPNRKELNFLFLNRKKIGGFVNNTKYWSSDPYSKNGKLVYEQLFNFQGYKDVSPAYSKLRVRAIRSLN